MKTERKPGSGGKRPGSGRKKLPYKTVKLIFRVHPDIADKCREAVDKIKKEHLPHKSTPKNYA